MHISNNFEDVRNLFYGLSGESNVLEANSRFLAFALSGAGGRMTVLKCKEPGRLKPVMPSFVAGSDICDFSLSIIEQDLLATASEDAKVRLWRIPETGLSEDISTPIAILSGHNNRVHHVQFHPFISDVLLSTSIEQLGMGGQQPTVRLWDIAQSKEMRLLDGFTDAVQGCAWAMDGSSTLATSCKDRQIRLFDSRQAKLINSTLGHEGARTCKLFFVGDQHLVSVGFGKGSMREMNMYDLKRFDQPMATHAINVSPSILTPHYDESSSVVFLAGKGDTSILPVEIAPAQSQPFFTLQKFDSPNASVQQGVSFVSKKYLDHANIEVARCWRLTQSNIEKITFTVPRNRREFFQDDLFPICRDDEEAMMDSSEWFNNEAEVFPPRKLDFCPAGMTRLSQAPAENKPMPKYTPEKGPKPMTESQKRQQFLDNLYKNAQDGDVEEVLPQDKMEGVDSDEWDD